MGKRPHVMLMNSEPGSNINTTQEEGYRRTAVWKINILAYGAGLLYLVITVILLGLIGIPGIITNYSVVTFSLEAPEAGSVTLAGDFNKWNSGNLKMKNSDGIWKIDIILKKRKVYTYNFIIDGKEWITDPDKPNTAEDGFGGRSSILEL